MADLQKYPVLRFLKFLANVAWYLGAFAGGLAIIFYVLIIAFKPQLPMVDSLFELPVNFEEKKGPVLPVESYHPEIRDIEFTAETGKIHFEHDSWFSVFYGALFILGALPVYLYSIYNIRMIFKNLSDREPFIFENVTLMRNAGFGLIGGSVIVGVGLLIIELLLRNDLYVDGARLQFGDGSGGETFLAGLVLLVLAEVFRAGVKMNEEQKLTI